MNINMYLLMYVQTASHLYCSSYFNLYIFVTCVLSYEIGLKFKILVGINK
jgi:hypothetical protein